ncbi:MAG: hypothetical protein L3K15_07055 [Thermoplasmata archaeon]|nr:hypothetical protein [Thermoplasmata archaeon]
MAFTPSSAGEASVIKDIRRILEFLEFFRSDLDWVVTNLKEQHALFYPQAPPYLPGAWGEIRPRLRALAQGLVDEGAGARGALHDAGLTRAMLQAKMLAVSIHREHWYNVRRSTATPRKKAEALRDYVIAVDPLFSALAAASDEASGIHDFIKSFVALIRA